MSQYAATYDRQSAPEQWMTTSYTVRDRRRGVVLESGLSSYSAASEAAKFAGGRVHAEQVYIGELPSMAGETRSVLIGP